MTKKYLTHLNKEHKKQQHCPTCYRYVKYNERYRDYICKRCVELATDKQGQLIAFHNITESGHGIQGVYTASGKLYRSTTCFIKAVKCKAEEAYLGGIVIKLLERDRKPKQVQQQICQRQNFDSTNIRKNSFWCQLRGSLGGEV
jgi:hypothetical protein